MMLQPMLDQLNVSRETLDRLDRFENTINKWNPKINLVSRSSLESLWIRHIVDSIQVYRCVPTPNSWVDLGSGGGFPGLIVAILAADDAVNTRVTLVESDQRKSAFLRTAARDCGISVDIQNHRIESVEPLGADVLSARALANLPTLLEYADLHMDPQGIAVFPKGATWEKELAIAQQHWRFDYEAITSLTEPDAVILKIWGVARV